MNDETEWVDVTDARDLLDLPDDTPVKVGGKITTAGAYAGLYVPGDVPLLIALAHICGVALLRPVENVTRSGRVLTDAEIDDLADEAERGYDVDRLLDRAERATEEGK